MEKKMMEYDLCIIGAGVAGGILAAYLGKQGKRICVIEKTFTVQERIVGELLQPGGVIKLQQMGLEHLLRGFDAQPVSGYGLFMDDNCFQISYPETENGKVSGLGFHNHKFIHTIREYLKTLPSVTLLEGNVTELLEVENRVNGVKFVDKQTEEEKTVHAALTVVCDGMFSAFRQQLSENEKRVSSFFLGLVLKNCQLPYKNHGHVIVAKPSPCLIYPISSTETRILIDFPQAEAPRKSPELVEYLHNSIAWQLPPSVRPSFIAAVEEGKFKVMPNHYIPAKPVFKPGAVLLGDSLNMRHPLTGGGMTAAFTDIKLFSDLLLSADSTLADYDSVVKQFYKTRHKQNATINILADALYGVMRNDDLKTACFEYLKRGGAYSEEPVSILSAISRDQSLLLRHFFAVAFYGIKGVMTTKQTGRRLKQSQRMLTDAVDIVAPLVLNEKPGRWTGYAFKMAEKVFS